MRVALFTLIFLAFLFRSLIPAGMMPGLQTAGKDRLFPLVICTINGAETIYVGADKIPDAPPCPFAPAFAQGVLLDAPVLAAPAIASTERQMAAEGRTSVAIASPYLSRGPPLS